MNFFFLITILMSSLGCKKNPEPETYLIPKDFKGRVNVIFNQVNGQPKKYENGRRVYEIPMNGILLTQFKDEYGIINHQYYYVDSEGKRSALEIYKFEHFEKDSAGYVVTDKNKVGIFLDGTTGTYGNSDDKRSVKWQEFWVTSDNERKNIEPIDSFESRVKKIINYDF
jgi:hypothetical protein